MSKLYFSLLMVFTMQNVFAEQLIFVTVRDNNFKVIKVLQKKDEISSFINLFNNRKEVDAQNSIKMNYKIDLNPGDQWLYDSSGYIRVLSKANVATYQVNAVKMNLVLGLKK